MDKRGEYQDFPSKIFCPTVPKISVGEPFCDSQNFWYRKSSWIRGGGGGRGGREYHDFLSKNFCPTVPKISVGEPVCVSQNFWYQKKFMDKRGEGREGVSGFSVKNFMSHIAEKYRR